MNLQTPCSCSAKRIERRFCLSWLRMASFLFQFHNSKFKNGIHIWWHDVVVIYVLSCFFDMADCILWLNYSFTFLIIFRDLTSLTLIDCELNLVGWRCFQPYDSSNTCFSLNKPLNHFSSDSKACFFHSQWSCFCKAKGFHSSSRFSHLFVSNSHLIWTLLVISELFLQVR